MCHVGKDIFILRCLEKLSQFHQNHIYIIRLKSTSWCLIIISVYLHFQANKITNSYINRRFSRNLHHKFHFQFETCWQKWNHLIRLVIILCLIPSSYSGATFQHDAICHGKSIHLHFTACTIMRWTSRERQVNWSVTVREVGVGDSIIWECIWQKRWEDVYRLMWN